MCNLSTRLKFQSPKTISLIRCIYMEGCVPRTQSEFQADYGISQD